MQRWNPTPDQVALIVGVAASALAIVAYIAGFVRHTRALLMKIRMRRNTADASGSAQSLVAESGFLSEYTGLWNSSLNFAEKVKRSYAILPSPLRDIPIALSLGVQVKILSNGDARITWDYHLLNLSRRSVSSENFKVWFTNSHPFSAIEMSVHDVDHNLPCDIDVISDAGNFKNMLFRFPFPILPGATLRYRVSYLGIGDYSDLTQYWWETDILRLTHKVHVNVILPVGLELGGANSTEVGPHGGTPDADADLRMHVDRVKTNGNSIEQYSVQWEKDYPKVGAVYKLSFPPKGIMPTTND